MFLIPMQPYKPRFGAKLCGTEQEDLWKLKSTTTFRKALRWQLVKKECEEIQKEKTHNEL